MLSLNKKQKNFIVALNFRIKELLKKTFEELKTIKKQTSLQWFFKIWRNQIQNNKISRKELKKHHDNKNLMKIFRAWKNSTQSSLQKSFYYSQCKFFHKTNLKIKTMKTLKLLWLKSNKMNVKAMLFLKKWSLRTIFENEKQEKKNRRKNELVCLYYDKILLRRTFKKLSHYLFFMKKKVPEVFLLRRYFYKMKEILKSKSLHKLIDARRVFELKMMKKHFRGLFIWKNWQMMKAKRNWENKIQIFYLLRENFCKTFEKTSKLDFLLMEHLEENNRNMVIKYWNALKKYHLEKELKRKKVQEMKGFFEILHKELYFKKILKIFKVNLRMTKFFKKVNEKKLKKTWKNWIIWLKNHKMMLADAIIFHKDKNKNMLKTYFFNLRKGTSEEQRTKSDLAKKFNGKNIMKRYFEGWIMSSHCSALKNTKIINDFRKYCAKKKVFRILQNFCEKTRKIIDFLYRKRMNILKKYFEFLKITSFFQIQLKKNNLVWIMNIFHQWKTLTKLKKIKKLESSFQLQDY